MIIKELADNRHLGICVFEVTGFPKLEEANSREVLGKYATSFRRITEEIAKLGGDSTACFEFLWFTEPVENQTFTSYIRFFVIVRKISGESAEGLRRGLKVISANLITSLNALRYDAAVIDGQSPDFRKVLEEISTETTLAVVKTEKITGSAYSQDIYCCPTIVPGQNLNNFEAVISALSRYTNCAISFQLFPDRLTAQEGTALSGIVSRLGQMGQGYPGQGFAGNETAEVLNVLSCYQRNMNAPFFLYNILVFGKREYCTDLAARMISLLKSGEEKKYPDDLGCYDLTAEHISLPSDWMFYPWNINNRLMYTYRNRQLIQKVPMAQMFFRFPYLMTSEEAASFFRLPLRSRSVSMLPENRQNEVTEQFDKSVVDPNSIQFGLLGLNSREKIKIGCPDKLFTKHAVIVGTPGSGKTTFSINLLLQFAKKGIPFLAIEPTKTEYRAMIDTLPDLQIFTPGNNEVSPFIINPFIPPGGISIEQFIPSLVNAFDAAFSMPSPLDIIFLRAVRACYSKYGWKNYSRRGDPDVQVFGLYEFILEFKKIIEKSNYSGEVKGNIQSAGVFRLMNLIEQNSNIYDSIHTVPIEDLLFKPTVLELNSIDNTDQKALIMALLLINICLYTKHNQVGDGTLKNILLIDEAHVLLGGGGEDGGKSQNTTVKALQDMIVEIRSYGTGIIIADQAPSKVTREIIANTDIKIAFRLVQDAEKRLIADSTNMQEDDVMELSKLKPGEAFVYFSKLEMPQLLQTEDIREREGIRLSVANSEISDRMNYWNSRKTYLRPFTDCGLCRSCHSDCDFKIRDKAEYLADTLAEQFGSRITDKKAMLQYLASTDKLIAKFTQNMTEEDRKRIVPCSAIRFKRKLQIQKDMAVSDKEMKMVINRLEPADG